jgi:hypothetical protein
VIALLESGKAVPGESIAATLASSDGRNPTRSSGFVGACHWIFGNLREDEEISARISDCEFSAAIPIHLMSPFNGDLMFKFLGECVRAVDVDRDRRIPRGARLACFGRDELDEDFVSLQKREPGIVFQPGQANLEAE